MITILRKEKKRYCGETVIIHMFYTLINLKIWLRKVFGFIRVSTVFSPYRIQNPGFISICSCFWKPYCTDPYCTEN
jgi:hypothetical protein